MSAPRTPRMVTERAVSAGGVVYRTGPGGQVEVLLCHRSQPPLWCLPKGTPDPGESIEETALREVREETGITATIVDSLGSIRYWFSRPSEGKRVDKTVHHFLMEPTGGSIDLHDHEFDVVEWVPMKDAVRRVSYRNEAIVLDRAQARIGIEDDDAA